MVMFKNLLFSTLFLCVFISCKKEKEVQLLNSSNYFDILNKEFSGDLAFETTSFVEKYWRVVGNTGFNKSVYRVAEQLEKAGFVNEDKATQSDILTYRIEKRPLNVTMKGYDGNLWENQEYSKGRRWVRIRVDMN